jgi:hypothetical protein
MLGSYDAEVDAARLPNVTTPHVAAPILASVHVRAREKAGHMNASDPITETEFITLRDGGRPHMAPG